MFRYVQAKVCQIRLWRRESYEQRVGFAAPPTLSCWTREDENGFEHLLIGFLIRYPLVATADRRCSSIGGAFLDI